MDRHYPRNRTLMWIFFAALVVLHHDWWLWNDGRLVFGFLPIGLGYQAFDFSGGRGQLGAGQPFTPGPRTAGLAGRHPGRAQAFGEPPPGLTVPASIPASTPHKAR